MSLPWEASNPLPGLIELDKPLPENGMGYNSGPEEKFRKLCTSTARLLAVETVDVHLHHLDVIPGSPNQQKYYAISMLGFHSASGETGFSPLP